MKRNVYLSLFVALMLITAGCGGGNDAATSQSGSDASEPTPAEATQSSDGVQEIVIQPVGDQMKFATEEFTVEAGSSVRLVMDNIATLEAMQHNIVVLALGADINTVGMAAIQAGPDNDYVPPGDENILFYTAIAKPGEKTMVEFTVPSEPGEYTFICTFPGHYSLMKGIMRVA